MRRSVHIPLLGTVSALALAAALFLQCRVGVAVLGSSPAAADAPAHFTTGVMVYDYFRTALGSSPMAFAESFYVRFPKVAFGHWPPAYYGAQTAWYACFGASISSAQWLSAATAFAIAMLLFFRLRRAEGTVLALASAAVFLALPCMQVSAWAVMSDTLTGLFVLLAVLAFSDLLRAPTVPGAAVRFAVWSSAAILTKGSAWALVPFALLTPLLARRPGCFRSPWYWASGAATLLLSAPFYLWARWSGIGYPVGYQSLTKPVALWHLRLGAAAAILKVAPLLLLAAAALAFAYELRCRWRGDGDSSPAWDSLAAGSWVIAQVLFLVALPLTAEGRVFIPALAPAVLLFGRLLGRLRSALRAWPLLAAGAPAALIALSFAGVWAVPMPRFEGYRAAAAAVPAHPEGTVMLVSADSTGEGAFIAERLSQDRRRAGVVLRASRVLAESNWGGYRYRPFFGDAGEVYKYVAELPVRYIIIESSATIPPEGRLLEEAVRSHSEEFRWIGRFPLSGVGHERWDEIRVYENLLAGDRRPPVIRTRLGLDAGGRILEYRWR
ncbi:MAG: glycosyltransferase family 39 protein [Bryobacteraceae bacterium]